MTNKQVLITGASGFVGRHLCQYLVECGWRVRAVVRSAAMHHALPATVDGVVVPDITGTVDWHPLLRDTSAVVHLVGRTHGLRKHGADPREAYQRINVDATRQLVRACGETGLGRFVFLSSIKVVGKGAAEEYTETTPCRPADEYGKTKWEAEKLVGDVGRHMGLATVILRPPLVYGPHVIGNFLRLLALTRRRLPLPLGAVRNARSLVFVGNLVSAVRRVLEHPAAAGEVFHVADDTPLSTRDLLHKLSTLQGHSPWLLPVPVSLLRLTAALLGHGLDVARLVDSLTVSTQKLRDKIGWDPAFTSDEGLRQTVQWFSALEGNHGAVPIEERSA